MDFGRFSSFSGYACPRSDLHCSLRFIIFEETSLKLKSTVNTVTVSEVTMPEWNRENLEAALRDCGWLISTRPIDHAVQFELKDGIKVNLYNTGRITFGGPKVEFKSAVEAFVNGEGSEVEPKNQTSATPLEPMEPAVAMERRVFVVHGHDIEARNDLELILRRVQVNPIILQNIPGVGDTLIEKLESLTGADFACVLLTPDDIGASASTPDSLRPRARQNVVLELGMVLSRLGRRSVAILVKGDNLEKPSDIDGLIYIPFKNKVTEASSALGAALATAGFEIDVRDLLGS